MRPRPIDPDQPLEIVSHLPEVEDVEWEELPLALAQSIAIPQVEQLPLQGRAPGFKLPETMVQMEGETVPEVEYLADGTDYEFLDELNGDSNNNGRSPAKSKKKKKRGPKLSLEEFEVVMTKLERTLWDAQEEAHAHERQTAEGEDLELPFHLDDVQCGVCFQRRKSHKNYIVECDMCGNHAHVGCAAFTTVEKRKLWRCQGCSDGLGYGKAIEPNNVPVPKTIECSLCPFGLDAGVMMRTLDKRSWVHPRCAFWLGSTLLGRRTVLKAVKLAPAGEQRENGNNACFICKRKSGAVVCCDHDGCKQHFHVSCAPKKDCYLNVDNIYFVHRNLTQAAAGGALAGAGPATLALMDEEAAAVAAAASSVAGRRTAKPNYKAYKKYNEISVNVSQMCPTHAPEEPEATLDAESIWSKVRAKIPNLLPDTCDDSVADALYEHWVDRRLENGKWGEPPLLRSLEARRSAQRQEKKKRKKEQKRLTLPTGGLLHIPTDPVYQEMLTARVEMDKARTIIDLLARRERLKKQLVQHDMDELNLEVWLQPEEEYLGPEVDVGELSTDKDADGTPVARPPPPRPPAMVVALPNGLPPMRNDIPLARNRRRGKPRMPRNPGQHLIRWPEDVERAAQKRDRPLLYDEDGAAVLDEDGRDDEDEDDDPEWAGKKYKSKKKSKKRR